MHVRLDPATGRKRKRSVSEKKVDERIIRDDMARREAEKNRQPGNGK